MIVREIKDHPELIDNFDWFNDYQDTRNWVQRNYSPELLEKLDIGYKQWLKKFTEKHNEVLNCLNCNEEIGFKRWKTDIVECPVCHRKYIVNFENQYDEKTGEDISYFYLDELKDNAK